LMTLSQGMFCYLIERRTFFQAITIIDISK
jgi:hypothetical protein